MKKIIMIVCCISSSLFAWPDFNSFYSPFLGSDHPAPLSHQIILTTSAIAISGIVIGLIEWNAKKSQTSLSSPMQINPSIPSVRPTQPVIQSSAKSFNIPIYNPIKIRTEADARKKAEAKFLQSKVAITILSDHGETPDAIAKQIKPYSIHFVCPEAREGISEFKVLTKTILVDKGEEFSDKKLFPTLTLVNWHTSQQKEEHYNTESKTWKRIRYHNLPELPDLD